MLEPYKVKILDFCWPKIASLREEKISSKEGGLTRKNREEEEKITRGTRFFSRFERTATFLGKSSPSLANLNFKFRLGMEVLEREVIEG